MAHTGSPKLLIRRIYYSDDLRNLGFSPVALLASTHTKGRQVAPFAKKFTPGDNSWHPEISSAGPVLVLVNILDQVIYVCRNGVRTGRSTISTGKSGKRRPTPVFTVLQKKVDHENGQ